jgi:predicted acyltransferase
MSTIEQTDLLAPRQPILRDIPVPEVQAQPLPEVQLAPPAAAAPEPPARLISLDAYRGLVMILMVSAGLYIPRVVKTFEQTPGMSHLKTRTWERLAYQTDHTPWVGCSLWDMIQPCFMFMVGAALAFSIASRKAKGQSFGRMLTHAIIRSLLLIWLGIFLTSKGIRTWEFVNVLTQIGLGYTFLFLLSWLKPRWQITAAAAILVLYWAAFAVYPKPPADLNPKALAWDDSHVRLQGFASHWEKNTNLASHVDGWFLNLFRPPKVAPDRFTVNGGGYATLNFIPSLATMIFGLLAGELLRSRFSAWSKVGILLGLGLVGLAVGWGLGRLGICPVVKRIWTPSWAIFSAGWALIALAVFYLIIDVAKVRFWTLPLVVVGANSIAMYFMSMRLKPWVLQSMHWTFGNGVYSGYGHLNPAYVPITEAAFFLVFCWAVCWWMYRKKVFIKI